MHKIRLSVALVLLCCARPAIAETTNFEMMGRINPGMESARSRDRSVRFSSARLDALQMSAAIDDDANALTLENWGDNRAGLAGSAKSSIKLTGAVNEASFKSDESYKPKAGQIGLSGQFGPFQIEASGERELPPDQGVSFANTDIGVGWKLGNLMLGEHIGGGYEGDNTAKYVIRPGQALAYRFGDEHTGIDFGYTFDGILDRNHYNEADTLRNGGQIIIRPAESISIGLRGSGSSLKGENPNYGYYTTNADRDEAGARVLWHVAGLPVTVGAEYAYAKLNEREGASPYGDDSYTYTNNYLTEINSFRAGLSANLLDNKLLAGIEYSMTKWTRNERHKTSYSYYGSYYGGNYAYYGSENEKLDPGYLSMGIEFRPIPNLAIRASHRYTEANDSNEILGSHSYSSIYGSNYNNSYSDNYSYTATETAITNSTAFGLGWALGGFHADAVFTHSNSKGAIDTLIMNEGRLELGVTF